MESRRQTWSCIDVWRQSGGWFASDRCRWIKRKSLQDVDELIELTGGPWPSFFSQRRRLRRESRIPERIFWEESHLESNRQNPSDLIRSLGESIKNSSIISENWWSVIFPINQEHSIGSFMRDGGRRKSRVSGTGAATFSSLLPPPHLRIPGIPKHPRKHLEHRAETKNGRQRPASNRVDTRKSSCCGLRSEMLISDLRFSFHYCDNFLLVCWFVCFVWRPAQTTAGNKQVVVVISE